jgi:hypothetical protein
MTCGKNSGNFETPNQHHVRYLAEKLLQAIDENPGTTFIGGVDRQKVTRRKAKNELQQIIQNKFKQKYPMAK